MAPTDELELSAALALVREIPDFPEPGVLFRDLGPVFADGPAFRALIDGLASSLDPATDVVVAIEARGFLLGAALAHATGLGVVPVRKPGKLPHDIEQEEYELEYGTDLLEIHRDAISTGQRVLVVDDVLATGGTAAATVRLVERLGGEVAGLEFVIELAFLSGRTKLPGRDVHSLLVYG